MKYKSLSKDQRIQVWEKYDHHCAYCGKLLSLKDMQVDHIHPIYRGFSDKYLKKHNLVRGADDISNYNPACRSCNRRKGTFTIEQFREQLANQFEWTIKNSRVKQCMDYNLLICNRHPIVFFYE